MSGPIEAGDLVVVVRGALECPAAPPNADVGFIFTVEYVYREKRLNRDDDVQVCAYCGGDHVNELGELWAGVLGGDDEYCISRLLKIDPPAAEESTEQSKPEALPA